MTEILALLSLVATYLSTAGGGPEGPWSVAAWTLGIPPPPASGLHILLGHLFIHAVPLGGPAFRLSLLSLLFMGLAALAVAQVLAGISRPPPNTLRASPWAPLALWVAVIALFLSWPGWSLALHQGPGSLALGLGWLSLGLAIRSAPECAFFLWGLALGVDARLMAFLPPLLTWIWFHQEKKTATPLRWLFWAALGWSPQLFFLFRSLSGPALDSFSPDHLSQWAHFVAPTMSVSQSLERAGAMILNSFLGITWVGGVLALFGLVELRRRHRHLYHLWQAGWLGAWLAGSFIQAPGPLGETLAVTWMALPLAAGVELLTRTWPSAPALGALLIPLSLMSHADVSRRNPALQWWGEALSHSLPEKAILWNPAPLVRDPLLYEQWVFGHREDLGLALEPHTAWGARFLRRQAPDALFRPPEDAGDRGGVLKTDLAPWVALGPRGSGVFADAPTRSLTGWPPHFWPEGLLYRWALRAPTNEELEASLAAHRDLLHSLPPRDSSLEDSRPTPWSPRKKSRFSSALSFTP